MLKASNLLGEFSTGFKFYVLELKPNSNGVFRLNLAAIMWSGNVLVSSPHYLHFIVLYIVQVECLV